MTHDEALIWLAEVFDEPAGSLRPDTPRDAVRNWDSMGMLGLMADIDGKFDIQLGEDEVEGMKSIQDVLTLLERHGAVSG